jgi:hypothetical protein
MTNKFLSKGTPFRAEPGPLASTDHVSPDEGIALGRCKESNYRAL